MWWQTDRKRIKKGGSPSPQSQRKKKEKTKVPVLLLMMIRRRRVANSTDQTFCPQFPSTHTTRIQYPSMKSAILVPPFHAKVQGKFLMLARRQDAVAVVVVVYRSFFRLDNFASFLKRSLLPLPNSHPFFFWACNGSSLEAGGPPAVRPRTPRA